MACLGELTVEPLTADEFAPFGDVIEARDSSAFFVNEGQAQRFHDLAKIDVAAGNGRPLISIFRSAPTHFPLTLHKIERHPLGSQAFIPLGNHQFLIVVASTTNNDFPDRPRVFLSNGHQGVNYKPGVWHHPLIALNHTTEFLVIDRGGTGANCDVAELSDKNVIESPEILNLSS